METIFINTENSKTDEPHRFRLTLAGKLNRKTLHLHITTINFKFLLQHGITSFI